MVPTVSLTMATTFSSTACTKKDASSCWATQLSQQPAPRPRGLYCRGPPSRQTETPHSLQGLLHQSSPGDRLLTCRRLMASRSRHTTSWPSQSDALKPFVQFRRMPWGGTKGRQEAGGSLESHFASPKPVSHRNIVYMIPSPVGVCPTLPTWLRALPSAPSQLSSGKKPINNHPTNVFYF